MPLTSRGADESTRKTLAFSIVGAGVVGVVVISGVAIIWADGDRAEMSRLVFSSILPLLGTWVGTVLAFYFAHENLAAATDSTLRLAGRDIATPITDVMIPQRDWLAYDLGPDQAPEDVPLSAMHETMGTIDPPSRRLPIRNASGAVLYVVHDSALTAYTEQEGQSTETLNKTLGDLLAVAEFKQLVEAIAFISESATVGDARIAMSSTKLCNDVFVTPTGKRDEPALGWLTNTLLAGVQ